MKDTSAVKVKISAIALDDVPTPCTFVSKERHLSVIATELSERWLVGLAQATATLKSTTQNIVRSAVLPLGRRYKADWLYHLTRLPGDWYTDTLLAALLLTSSMTMMMKTTIFEAIKDA